MPLLGTKIHVLNPIVKKDRKKANADTPTKPRNQIVIEHTQEICKDSAEQKRKNILYKEKIWTCRVTGRLNMSHKEALKSEQANIKYLSKNFPKCFERAVLDIVHHSTESLENVVHKCYLVLHQEFCINEPVTLKVKAAGKEIKGIIVKVDIIEPEATPPATNGTSPSASDKENGAKSPPKKTSTVPEKKPYKYGIKLLDQDKIISKVPFTEIIREFKPPSKEIIKMYIRAKAMRYGANYSGPWIVDEDAAKKHKISDKNSDFSLDKNKVQCISTENEIEALRRIQGSSSAESGSPKKRKSSDNKNPFKATAVLSKSGKKMKQSTLFEFAGKKVKSPPGSPFKSSSSKSFGTPGRTSIPPLAAKLIKSTKDGSKDHTITQLLNKCAQVLTDKQINVLPLDIRERVRSKQVLLAEKKKIAAMTAEEKLAYSKQKRDENRKKMNEVNRQKKMRFEDTELPLESLPEPELVSTPEGISDELFGRVVVITEFIHCYKGLLIPNDDELNKSFQSSAELLLQSLSCPDVGFQYLARILVVMLRTLLQDDSSEVRVDVGTKLVEIPLNLYTTSEMLRNILKPKSSINVSRSSDKKKESDDEDSDEETDEIENDEKVMDLLQQLETSDFFSLTMDNMVVLLEALHQRLLNSNIVNDYIENCSKKALNCYKKKIAQLKVRNDLLKMEKMEKKKNKEKEVTDKASKKQVKAKKQGISKYMESKSEDLATVVKNRRAKAKENALEKEEKDKEEKIRREKEFEKCRVDLAVSNAEKDYEEAQQECRLVQRLAPLGYDRDHGRYFCFGSTVPGIYVEQGWSPANATLNHVSANTSRLDAQGDMEVVETTFPRVGRNRWYVFQDPEELDCLVSSLNEKGVRESALRSELEKVLEATKRSMKNAVTPKLETPDEVKDAMLEGFRAELLLTESHLRAGSLGVVPNFDKWQKTVTDPTASVTQMAKCLLEMFNHVEERFYFGAFKAKVPKTASPDKETGEVEMDAQPESEVSPVIDNWKEAVRSASTFARLNFLLAVLDAGINWDKSVEHAKCRICRRPKGEDTKLVVCELCNAAFHLYCLRPALTRVPQCDWYCAACGPTEKRQRHKRSYRETQDSDEEDEEEEKIDRDAECLICESSEGKMLSCSTCPSIYHLTCTEPPLRHAPRGDWSCNDCRGTSNVPVAKKRGRRGGGQRAKPKVVEESDDEDDDEEESEDEDERPKKKTGRPAARAAAAAKKKTKAKVEESDEEEEGEEESEDEEEDGESESESEDEKPRKKSGRAAKKTKPLAEESEEESANEDSEEEKPKKRGRSARVPKIESEEEEESEDEVVVEVPAKKAKTTASKKRSRPSKKLESSDDEEEVKTTALKKRSRPSKKLESSDEEDEAKKGVVKIAGKRGRSSASAAPGEPVPKKTRVSASATGSGGPAWLKIARSLHEQLCKHNCADDFMEPVDAEDAPDYHDIIKEPIDLTTMGTRLRDEAYSDMQDFIKDVGRMFDNAFEYNPPGSETLDDAKKLIKYFRARLEAQAPAHKLRLKTPGI